MANELQGAFEDIVGRVLDLEDEIKNDTAIHGETDWYWFVDSLAQIDEPHHNQLAIVTTETGTQPGGRMYRYDRPAGAWLALN